MQRFFISRDGIKAYVRMALTKWAAIVIVTCLTLMLLAMVIYGERWSEITVLGSMLLFTGLFASALLRNIRKGRIELENYQLIITEDSIVAEPMNGLAIVMPIKDVCEILRGPDGGLLIVNADRSKMISIYARMERREELEKLLTAIVQITPWSDTAKMPWLLRYQYHIGLFVAASIFTTLLATNRYIVSISGLAFAVSCIYLLTVLHTTRLMDAGSKRMGYVIIPVIVLGTLYYVVSKWIDLF